MNLYAYCLNNPVMGYDPEGTWDWGKFAMNVLSGLAIVGGVVLVATGAGAVAGGALIGAGVGSLAGGYIAESTGNNFAAGWLIGAGVGAGGGALIGAAATASVIGIGGAGLATATGGVTSVAATGIGAAAAVGALGSVMYMGYQRKPAAPRIHSGTRKEAYDKAFLKGGKKKPTLHYDGKFGSHFHPAGKFSSWHFYFSILFGILGFLDEIFNDD